MGIDNSAEMLSKAPQQPNLTFINRSIQDQLQQDETWDLIVANASLQWVNDHHTLIPTIIESLNAGGQLAIQMPSQKETRLNQLLDQLVYEEPYFEILSDVIRHSPVLPLDDYIRLLITNGAKALIVYQKVYPIVAQAADVFFDFISGTALIPSLETLREPMRVTFEQAYKTRIEAALHIAQSLRLQANYSGCPVLALKTVKFLIC